MNKATKDNDIVFSDYLVYDETSTTLVRWKVPMDKNIEGWIAGTKGSGGYMVVRINKIQYLLHRVIWILYYGSIDSTKVIDHLDGDGYNNSVANMRLVYQKENLRNQKLPFTNKSGNSGVGYYSYKGLYPYYMSSYCDENGKLLQKTFSLSKYGSSAKASAIQWREDNLNALKIKGVHYTERHGT